MIRCSRRPDNDTQPTEQRTEKPAQLGDSNTRWKIAALPDPLLQVASLLSTGDDVHRHIAPVEHRTAIRAETPAEVVTVTDAGKTVVGLSVMEKSDSLEMDDRLCGAGNSVEGTPDLDRDPIRDVTVSVVKMTIE